MSKKKKERDLDRERKKENELQQKPERATCRVFATSKVVWLYLCCEGAAEVSDPDCKNPLCSTRWQRSCFASRSSCRRWAARAATTTAVYARTFKPSLHQFQNFQRNLKNKRKKKKNENQKKGEEKIYVDKPQRVTSSSSSSSSSWLWECGSCLLDRGWANRSRLLRE